MIVVIYVLLVCLVKSKACNAFVSPSPTAIHSIIRTIHAGGVSQCGNKMSQSAMTMLPENCVTQFSSIVLTSTSEAADAEAMASLQGLRTFFGASTALVFAAIALYFVTGAIIVPKAAQQLERDTKRLRPGLWEEYEARAGLKEGEKMTDRPELLEELGSTMRPIIMADFETLAEAKSGPPPKS